MNNAVGLFLTLHGVAHLVGFLIPSKLLVAEDLPFSTRLYFGKIEAGERGVRMLGLIWLALAVGFVLSGIALMGYDYSHLPSLVLLSIISLFLSILGLPFSPIGIFVNAVILLSVAIKLLA